MTNVSCKETETMADDETIVLRDYQVELYHDIVKRRSSILFLPTGSGKTHIAFWLIKSMAADLKKPVVEGGKRTFFLVNTVQLVHQQAALLTKLGNFNVVRLTGDNGVDCFNGDHWHELEKEYEVFVMTTQIYLDALNSSFLLLENANLLVLDECHHATGHHPMAQVMRLVHNCPENTKPKILGLTATLLNANVRKQTKRNFCRKLSELEATFGGRIITAKNCHEIRASFSAQPNEDIVHLPKYEVSQNDKLTLENLCNEGVNVLSAVKLKDNVLDLDEEKDIQLHKPGLNRSKLLQSALKDILVHVEGYGLYMGYTCCQGYITQLYRYMWASGESLYMNMILYIFTLAQMMRKVLHTSILASANCGPENFQSWTTIVSTSSKKVDYLFARLRRLTAKDKCIVFVERKMTAKSLYRIIKLFVDQQTNYQISVDFIVGSDSNPLRNSREGHHDRGKHKEILDNFRDGSTNVLVATDVVEEGIDVPQCNLVIMFDRIKTYRSYIQSRGRARMKGSEYVVLNDDPSECVDAQIEDFRNIDRQFMSIIDQKDILEGTNEDLLPMSETTFDEYVTPTGAKTTSISAVSKIYQYCSILPADLFTDLLPYWFYNIGTGTCKLRLPANSGTRLHIRGPARSSQKEAKQAAALEGVKLLHRLNLLDDHLLPVRIPKEMLDTDHWFPNWDARDAEEQKRVRSIEDQVALDRTFNWPMRTPSFLKNCRPRPGTECYLHIIKTKTEYENPKIPRQRLCHEFMKLDDFPFGILTRERLPSICKFPVYSDLGEITITLETNVHVFVFTQEEVDALSKFHRTLLVDILKAVPSCFAYDVEEDSNGYFLVPLVIKEAVIKLAWRYIKTELEVDVKQLSDELFKSPEYKPELYRYKVITPWYRPIVVSGNEAEGAVLTLSGQSRDAFAAILLHFDDDQMAPGEVSYIHFLLQRYIVCDIAYSMNLYSEFNERFATYEEYFSKKYELTSSRPELPLLLVRPITTNLDGIIPKPITVSEKKRRRTKDKNTYFPPEFCHQYSFPVVYWYKTIILPSVLHRMFHLLLAEDLRRKFVNEAGLGRLNIPPSEDESVQYFKMATKEENNDAEVASSSVDEIVDQLAHQDLDNGVREKVNPELEIKDIDRASDITLQDIKKYVEYVKTPLVSLLEGTNESQSEGSILLEGIFRERPENFHVKFVRSPELMTLREYEVTFGPQPHEILEALTLRVSDDALHLERLETLGDSVLKYLVSTSTFIECAQLNEGHLTCLKGRLVSNQNLFYCGTKLDIASYIKGTGFSTRNFWCPPGFSLPRKLLQKFTGVPLSALLTAKLPYEEQLSGNVSEETIETILKTDIAEYIEKRTAKDEFAERRMQFYLGKQELRRKNVSDVLEALLGVYLKTCGLSGAFKLLQYYGIPSRAASLQELYSRISSPMTSSSDVVNSIESLLPDYKNIEKLLNYEFSNKYYLLQAFTHASYTGNYVTGCYQKLEFIGDAVLDFLITSYIFEYCDNLSPGQLTDLRSSLVNNNTFGAFVVRLQLHRHLLYHSQRLTEAVHTFVLYQENKNYEIHGNELVRLISEEDVVIAEEVDVPKALGDIFESLAGAIFLDSGCNLSAVWNVYYSIMKNEIDKFSECIPINPVRALYERVVESESMRISFSTVQSKLGSKVEQSLKEKIKVSLKVTSNEQTKEYIGRGDTKKTAKRAAAKFALRDLNYKDFLI